MSYEYDAIPAGYYDEIYRKGSGPQSKWHQHKFRRIVREIGDAKSHLDFGSGPGTLARLLPAEVKYVGIDVAAPQIEYARKHYGGDNRIFVQNDSSNLPFDSNKFDAATCVEVVEHLEYDLSTKILKEINRVLKPNGKLIVTTPNYRSCWPLIELAVNRLASVSYEEQHICKFTPLRLKTLLRDAGFRKVRISCFMGFAPFLSMLSNSLSDRCWELDQHFAHFSLTGLLLLGVAFK